MESVWYQVIDGLIFPLDVVRETPHTILLNGRGRRTRLRKEGDGHRCFPTRREALVQAVRDLEDRVAHHRAEIEHHTHKLAEAAGSLAALRADLGGPD